MHETRGSTQTVTVPLPYRYRTVTVPYPPTSIVIPKTKLRTDQNARVRAARVCAKACRRAAAHGRSAVVILKAAKHKQETTLTVPKLSPSRCTAARRSSRRHASTTTDPSCLAPAGPHAASPRRAAPSTRSGRRPAQRPPPSHLVVAQEAPKAGTGLEGQHEHAAWAKAGSAISETARQWRRSSRPCWAETRRAGLSSQAG